MTLQRNGVTTPLPSLPRELLEALDALRCLIVDDDPKFRRTMQLGLEEFGIGCSAVGSADEADRALTEATGPFDLILLDVMMPERSGWDFLESLRARGDETPVIFLTARHEVEERIRGLSLGADDYVIKPFELHELIARIAAVQRRRAKSAVLEIGPLRLDLNRRRVEHGGRTIELSEREFDLLLTLARRPGQVCTRAELLRAVWSIDFDPGTNVVDVVVARLRRKLHPTGRARVETVVGEGYRLAAGDVAA